MSDEITFVEISDAADGVKTVQINVPGVQGPVGPSAVFKADTFDGVAAPAALTLKPIAEGSDTYGLFVTVLE